MAKQIDDFERLTDPAVELFELCEFLGSTEANPSNQNVGQVLPAAFGCDMPDAEFFELLAVAHGRFERFGSLLDELDDPLVDPILIQRAKSAANHLQRTINFQNFGTTWNSVRADFDQSEFAFSIRMMSQTLRRTHPLR